MCAGLAAHALDKIEKCAASVNKALHVQIYLRQGEPQWLFVNFNQVVDWLAFGEAHGISVGVDWTIPPPEPEWHFNYGGADENVWNNYFEPLPCTPSPDLCTRLPWTPHLGGFRAYAFYRRLESRRAGAELNRLHTALKNKVRLLPFLKNRIQRVAQAFQGHAMIGVHLRNPVGSRGLYSRFQGIDLVAQEIDAIAAAFPIGSDWRIFAASDREGMIEALAARYPGRVLCQNDVTRAAEDSAYEIHAASPPSHDLGADVITDCWLLSQCDYLVGMQSSVCLAACIINPDLKFRYARTPVLRMAGAAEYYFKTLWCAVFEANNKAHESAQRLVRT